MFRVVTSYGEIGLETDLNIMTKKGYKLVSVMQDGSIMGMLKQAHYTTVWNGKNEIKK